MRIAAVIPLYNHEAFVAAAIDSLLVQSLPPDRIIVIDDGSTDRGLEVVRAFGDSRIESLRQENSGAHAALNRGIAMAADCDLVAILNSDDVFHPHRLERCAEHLARHPEHALVCTGLELIDDHGVELDDDEPKARWVHRVWQARRDDLIEWLGIANFAKTTSNFVARHRFLSERPFAPYRYVHDYHLLIRATLEGALGLLPERLLFYRTHATNTIKFGPAENVTREVLAMQVDLLKESAPRLADDAAFRAAYNRFLRSLMGNHADFRSTVFVAVLAELLAQTPPATLADAVARATAARFPELNEPAGRVLREALAEEELRGLQRQAAASRWLALGKVFGVDLAPPQPAPGGAEAALATYRKRVAKSRWASLGKKLGFGPTPDAHAR
jgi:glycosyltransferase involved in cell wall biosynthesis